MPRLSHEHLVSTLSYDPETGIFRWKTRPSNRVRVGDVAGTAHNAGYWMLRVGGESLLAHRLAYFYMEGRWPDEEIDHADGDRRNNKWSNLRAATRTENARNTRTRGRYLKGTFYRRNCPGKPWHAQIQVDGRTKNLGLYETEEQAHAAYLKAAKVVYGDFYCVRPAKEIHRLTTQ